MDLVTFGESMLRLSPPNDGRLETATAFDVHVAGAESNVAIAAQRLGTDATWLSKLPDSPLGRRVVNELRASGVDVEVSWQDGGKLGVYYLELAGAPRGTRVLYDRANAAVTTSTIDELAIDRIAEASTFFTTGITPALSSQLERTTGDLLEVATDAGVTTAFDLNYRASLWSPADARASIIRFLPSIDVLVTPDRDARTVLGLDGTSEEIARELAARWSFETVVVTVAEEGALAIHDGETVKQPAFETETVDPIGTGDAFVGAFLARRIEGGDVASALEYGAATAALKRTISGDVAVVTRAEVERVIDEGVEGITR